MRSRVTVTQNYNSAGAWDKTTRIMVSEM